MKKIFATLLIGATGLAYINVSAAADPKATYKEAKDRADNEYKTAREKCKTLTGNPKDVCEEEAKAARTRMKEEAEANYKNTPRARTNARTAIANAEYDVAKAKCDAKSGNDKDVCIQEAKAASVAAKADAKADKAVASERANAKEEKMDANEKAALEKCDAMSGAAKDKCVASAKMQPKK